MTKNRFFSLRGSLMLAGSMLAATTAMAQTPDNTPAESVEQVVVTGSHIRGVAPVGSTVINLDAEEIQKQGAGTVVELLSDLPQVTNIGSSSSSQNSGRNVQGGAGNQTYSNSINLRGLGSQNTLNLVNGVRLVPEQTGDIWDIDAVPTMLIRNIDIVADGGSATYGADAITGTVNLVLRQPENIVQTMARVGNSPGRTDYQGGLLVGREWTAPGMGDGGFVLAMQYYHTDPLYATDRPGIYNDNLQQYLGPTAQGLPTFSNPSNVVINGVTYAVPSGIKSAQGVTLAQLGPANQPNLQSAFSSISRAEPSNTRWNAGFTAKQDITDWLSFFGQGYAQWRRAAAFYSSAIGGATDVSISVPSTNPYSPCATGVSRVNGRGIACPANGTVTVQENIQGEIGPQQRIGTDKQFSLAGGFNVKLPYDWKATVQTNLAQDFTNGNVTPSLNQTALTQVVTGTGKPSSVPFFNPFCDDSKIGPACNDPVTNSYISGYSETLYTNILSQTMMNLDGPIVSLPGGELRLAVGGEYDNESLFANATSTTSAAIGVAVHSPANARRNVAAWYAEAFVPIVGPDNRLPFIQSLQLTLANRYTAYSDFGVTDNPKFGVDYVPFDGLKLHGSYGTSFRAPSLRDASSLIATSLHAANSNSSNYVGITAPSNVQLSDVEATGGNPVIRPETAITWSMGAKWTPPSIAGLDVDLNYYSISLKAVIGQAARDAGDPGVANASGQIYDQFLIFNPTYFPSRAVVSPAAKQLNPALALGAPLTQAQFNGIITTAYNNPIYAFPALPAQPITFFCQCQRANGGPTYTDGFDISVNYIWDMDWATAHAGASGTYVLDYNTGLTQISPIQDELNSLTFPIKFAARLQAGLEKDGLDGTVYLNFKNAYHIDPSLLPAATPSQFYDVPAYATVDLSLSYHMGADRGFYLGNSMITLAATNVFNQGPPLTLNSDGILYDATQASDLGRHISLTLTKMF